MKTKRQGFPAAYLLVAGIFTLACLLSLVQGIPIGTIMVDYQYNVLVILIVMELFTNLVTSTGIMQLLATKLAIRSKGNKRLITLFFGTLMFFISAFLNNITAVMVILPVVFVLLKALNLDRRYIAIFFAVTLALSNTGGASSPIGDFPAIVIMTSGITTFVDYLIRAMPLFIITSAVLLAMWVPRIKKDKNVKVQQIAIDLLQQRHKHIVVDYKTLIPLLCILAGMFIAWSFVPQDIMPPEVVAVLGYAIGAVTSAANGKRVNQNIDFKAVLTIAAFLFLAGVVSATGWLSMLAAWLQTAIASPVALLMVIMLITSVMSGLFSAGPAAAAMMPVIVNLCNTTLSEHTHWVAIAYAASICAGSSMFLWSATAGFILSDKVEKAKLDNEKEQLTWNIRSYMGYGFLNYVVQMAIGMIFILIVLTS